MLSLASFIEEVTKTYQMLSLASFIEEVTKTYLAFNQACEIFCLKHCLPQNKVQGFLSCKMPIRS